MGTFLLVVTFLNMLIAIMGDAFTQATEERENNARLTKLGIMGDYVHLINKNDVIHDVDADKWGFVIDFWDTYFPCGKKDKDSDTVDKDSHVDLNV